MQQYCGDSASNVGQRLHEGQHSLPCHAAPCHSLLQPPAPLSCLQSLALLLCGTIIINMFYILTKGARNLIQLPYSTVAWASVVTGVVVAALLLLMASRFVCGSEAASAATPAAAAYLEPTPAAEPVRKPASRPASPQQNRPGKSPGAANPGSRRCTSPNLPVVRGAVTVEVTSQRRTSVSTEGSNRSTSNEHIGVGQWQQVVADKLKAVRVSLKDTSWAAFWLRLRNKLLRGVGTDIHADVAKDQGVRARARAAEKFDPRVEQVFKVLQVRTMGLHPVMNWFHPISVVAIVRD